MVTGVEDDLAIAKIIKAVGNMNRTSLKWQTQPALLMVEFSVVLMEFGWLIDANVIPGVVLPTLTPTVSIMLLF